MRIAQLTTTGLAAASLAAVGLCALSTAPALSQELYVRSAEPYGSTVIVREEPDYVAPPGERVIVRDAAPPVVVRREAPERVIVAEPMDGPYADEVYVRDVPPFPPPAPRVVPRAPDCRTVEHESASGLVRVSTYCD